MVAGRGGAGALEVGGASVVVGSNDVDVGASVLEVVDSGAARPTATLAGGSLWPATATPAAASRRTTPPARPRTILRRPFEPAVPVVVVILPFASFGEASERRRPSFTQGGAVGAFERTANGISGATHDGLALGDAGHPLALVVEEVCLDHDEPAPDVEGLGHSFHVALGDAPQEIGL